MSPEHRALRVAVVGASGYTGLELLRVLSGHPRVVIAAATSRGNAGQRAPVPGVTFSDPEELRLEEVDAVFLALPHGEAARWMEERGADAPPTVDLTADHRPGSGRESGWVYGLSEIERDRIRGSRRIANPGCYPTGVILALHPLLEADWVDPDRTLVVQAASGVTGAGRTPRTDLLFAEVAENFRAYGVGNAHRHLLEMRALLPGADLLFTPHLLPVSRGILETITLPVREPVPEEEVRRLWLEAWRESPCVTVLDGELPDLASVRGTDRVRLAVRSNAGLRRPALSLFVAFDNLGKGAAGQAVQNLNLLFGLPEHLGLRR